MRARDHAPVSVSPAKTAELDDSKSSIQGAVCETRARGEVGGGGGYSHILAIWICAAGKSMVFKPFGLVLGLVIIENWSSIGSRLTGSLKKD